MRWAILSAGILLTAHGLSVADDSDTIRQTPNRFGRSSVTFDLALVDDTSRHDSDIPNKQRRETSAEEQEYDDEIARLNEAITLEPTEAGNYINRGYFWTKKRQYGKAIDDFNRGLSFEPEHVLGLNNLAMLRATCCEGRYRNGQKAVELAKQACGALDWKDSACLDTLAAAYAETGDFDAAVEYQQKALDLNPMDVEFRIDAKKRLALYEDHKPYRE